MAFGVTQSPHTVQDDGKCAPFSGFPFLSPDDAFVPLSSRGERRHEGLNGGRQGENLFPFRFTQESFYKLKGECYYMLGLVASNEMT